MAAGMDDTIDIVERGAVRLKSIFGGVVVAVGIIGTGAMEFRDIRNDITDIQVDKLGAVIERHNNLKESVDQHTTAFTLYKSDMNTKIEKLIADNDRVNDRLIDDIRSLQSQLMAIENSVSRIHLSLSKVESDNKSKIESLERQMEGINTKVGTLKDDVLTLVLKSGGDRK